MLTLMSDIAMTRRKLFHFVLDEQQTLLWSGQSVGYAIDWLHGQGHRVVRLDTGERKYDLAFDLTAK